jgi:hypothetical protein
MAHNDVGQPVPSTENARIEARQNMNGNVINSFVSVTLDETFIVEFRCRFNDLLPGHLKRTKSANVIVKHHIIDMEVLFDCVYVNVDTKMVHCDCGGPPTFSIRVSDALLEKLRICNFID